MSQVFPRSANVFAPLSLVGAGLLVVGVVAALLVVNRSAYATEINSPVPQPIDFSHRHHVGEEGFDCRYCHATAETSAFAGMPASTTCMNCHSQVLAQSPKLAVLRQSVQQNVPIIWNRVYQLPDYVYFDHSAHVTHGIGCETCHGEVNQMSGMWKATSLQMSWCLDCHNHPEKYVRPLDAVYQMGYVPAIPQAILGPQLVAQYGIKRLTDCSTCHR
jgi:hypothetical protein